jgi:hypothetical protein
MQTACTSLVSIHFCSIASILTTSGMMAKGLRVEIIHNWKQWYWHLGTNLKMFLSSDLALLVAWKPLLLQYLAPNNDQMNNNQLHFMGSGRIFHCCFVFSSHRSTQKKFNCSKFSIQQWSTKQQSHILHLLKMFSRLIKHTMLQWLTISMPKIGQLSFDQVCDQTQTNFNYSWVIFLHSHFRYCTLW